MVEQGKANKMHPFPHIHIKALVHCAVEKKKMEEVVTLVTGKVPEGLECTTKSSGSTKKECSGLVAIVAIGLLHMETAEQNLKRIR